MAEWLGILLAVLVLPVAFLLGAAFVATSSLRRANQVLPGRAAAPAPLWWLWSPGPGAMLHRRLRSACALASSVGGPIRRANARPRPWGRKGPPVSDGIADLAREVMEEAVVLDRQVLLASHMAHGVTRAHALGALDYQVRALEDAARRVHQLATRRAMLSRPSGPEQLSLDQRIAAMEAAISELTPPPG